MGGRKGRLEAMARASRFSHRYFNSRRKKQDAQKWLEVKKEIEALCGSRTEEERELIVQLMQRAGAARRSGLEYIPMPSDMTVIRKKRY